MVLDDFEDPSPAKTSKGLRSQVLSSFLSLPKGKTESTPHLFGKPAEVPAA
jgi:hypothetical protein